MSAPLSERARARLWVSAAKAAPKAEERWRGSKARVPGAGAPEASELGAPTSDSHAGDEDGTDAIRLGEHMVSKYMSRLGARGYVGIICAASFAHKLLVSGRSVTQRELYYYHKGGTWSPWRTQEECNESVADLAVLFDAPRWALGFHAHNQPASMAAALVRSWNASPKINKRESAIARGEPRRRAHAPGRPGRRAGRWPAHCGCAVQARASGSTCATRRR